MDNKKIMCLILLIKLRPVTKVLLHGEFEHILCVKNMIFFSQKGMKHNLVMNAYGGTLVI